MDTFFTDLKNAREAKGISLTEISDATLISIKLLEALERGDVHALPQAYIRAFIREYAATVGLDSAETMERYDARSKGVDAMHTGTPLSKHGRHEYEPREGETFNEKFRRSIPLTFKIGLAIVLLVLIDIVLWNALDSDPTPAVKETPFGKVVEKQAENSVMRDTSSVLSTLARSASATVRAADSIRNAVAVFRDSLTLVGTTSDSVWMQIILDDDNLTEHFLYPRTTRTWKAKSQFLIPVIGNPGAITLTLNGKQVSIPIRPGVPTRNFRLTRDSLRTGR